MRTTITLDDNLIAIAQEYTGLTSKSAIVHEALKGLVQRVASQRLARLGSSQPQLKNVPRRRPAA
jgi:Arc/MetJ family transcription regulator